MLLRSKRTNARTSHPVRRNKGGYGIRPSVRSIGSGSYAKVGPDGIPSDPISVYLSYEECYEVIRQELQKIP
jgi:hypothetical protein